MRTDLNFTRLRVNHLPGLGTQAPLDMTTPPSVIKQGERGESTITLSMYASRPHLLKEGQVLGTVYVERANGQAHVQLHDATVTDVFAAPIALRATDWVIVRGCLDPARDALTPDRDAMLAKAKEMVAQSEAALESARSLLDYLENLP